MLTNMTIRNFKRFDEVEIPLGNSAVFIGPNNSGKTAALQALALWDVGLRRWQERYKGKTAPEKRPGVTINRRDLIAIPIPRANLLWRDLRTRLLTRESGKQRTENVRIDIVVDGISSGESWRCGLEFDYANEESFYCRPLRRDVENLRTRMPVPDQALQTKVAYLPPMSGLAAIEPKWELGRVNVLIGEGQTAQVLRNLCFGLAEDQPEDWHRVKDHIQDLFGAELERPVYIAERGEITMSYSERSVASLALSASGRGLQQTLLLLAFLYTNPGAVFLLDEPDAHLEILRQRQIYSLLLEIASHLGSQIIAASHSEVILNEAADQDVVIAFVGKPHRIGGSTSQVAKALKQIGYQDYYQAEQTGWVLYLEGSTDLANLRALAKALDHSAAKYLARPFVKYVDNQPIEARKHFYGIREAIPDLVGVGVYDNDARLGDPTPSLLELKWQQREVENYLVSPSVLKEYARTTVTDSWPEPGPIFLESRELERQHRFKIMEEVIEHLAPPVALENTADSFWREGKGSDFLERAFAEFFRRLKLYNSMSKSTYHRLAALAKPEELDKEVIEVLDRIVEVAEQAEPAGS